MDYSYEHTKINWKGKNIEQSMPSGGVLVDVLTRKIKLRCIKITVLGTLPLGNSKDLDPYQTVGEGSISNLKAGSRSVSK